jgi:hypothetical protein
MGVELAMAFKEKAGIELPVTGLGAGTTVRSLARDVVVRVQGGEAAVPAVDPLIARHGAEEEATALGPLADDDVVDLEESKMRLLP